MVAPACNPVEQSTAPSIEASVDTDYSSTATTTTSTTPSTPSSPTPSQAPLSFQGRRINLSKNGQCTHLTMTRMYTTEYRCMLCGHHSATGWLFRCTQDRELMLEDGMERGYTDSFDGFEDHFPTPARRPRGPVARASKLSFLEEVDDKHLDTYTASQIGLIIEQRSHVLRTAQNHALFLRSQLQSPNIMPVTPTFIPNPPSPTKSPLHKPWLPVPIGECQFKTCSYCRPSARERSFLSLNGIANDDFPATAITGFGFHLLKERPVASVDIVKNLGLREPPRVLREVSEGVMLERRTGLGIWASGNRPLPDLPVKETVTPLALPLTDLLTSSTDEDKGMVDITNIMPTPCSDKPNMPFSTPTKTSPTPEHISELHGNMGIVSLHPALTTSTNSDENIIHDPVPIPPSPVPNPDLAALPTTVEEQESSAGFSATPLEVPQGIAVTEEAIELRVADLITQF